MIRLRKIENTKSGDDVDIKRVGASFDRKVGVCVSNTTTSLLDGWTVETYDQRDKNKLNIKRFDPKPRVCSHSVIVSPNTAVNLMPTNGLD